MNKLSINKDIKELNNNKKINDLSCNIKNIFNINFKKDKNSLYFSDYKEQLSLMINDIIRQILYDQVYDQNRAKGWCDIISNKIIEVLQLQKSEFKFICISTILSKGSSTMNRHSTCLWNPKQDGVITVKYENESMYAFSSLYGIVP